MRILALEPYYGGSHRHFLDGLSRASRHTWTLLTLPAHKWKWRMRHSAVTFARQTADLVRHGRTWDLLFCSDMLNLAEFTALAPPEIAALPAVIYFHENQLTYPVRIADERDYQFAMTNFTSALAADRVWFNSEFHRTSFLAALRKFLKSMPDHQPTDAIEEIAAKSSVHPPGVADPKSRRERAPGPLRILWVARWEHDKNPEDFFEALGILKAAGLPFRLSVLGQSFRDRPPVFDRARTHFQEHIDHWGYQRTQADYENVLACSDVVVSTAKHEFFGIAIVEAVSSGALPLLPNRLSYPEIIGLTHTQAAAQFFYDGTVSALAQRLEDLARRCQSGHLWPPSPTGADLVARFCWSNLAPLYDRALQAAESGPRSPAAKPGYKPAGPQPPTESLP